MIDDRDTVKVIEELHNTRHLDDQGYADTLMGVRSINQAQNDTAERRFLEKHTGFAVFCEGKKVTRWTTIENTALALETMQDIPNLEVRSSQQ